MWEAIESESFVQEFGYDQGTHLVWIFIVSHNWCGVIPRSKSLVARSRWTDCCMDIDDFVICAWFVNENV